MIAPLYLGASNEIGVFALTSHPIIPCRINAPSTSIPATVRDNRKPTRKSRNILGRGGGMVDAADLKSSVLTGVWVRIPPSVPKYLRIPVLPRTGGVREGDCDAEPSHPMTTATNACSSRPSRPTTPGANGPPRIGGVRWGDCDASRVIQ